MAKTAQASQAALVGGGRQRVVGYDRDHSRAMAGTDLPQMQVRHAVTLGLQPVADDGFDVLVGADIEQHRAGIPDQPVGPAGDHQAADDSDRRIGPDPLRGHRDHQRHNGQDRRRGVGQHVDIGRAKIVVVVMMLPSE